MKTVCVSLTLFAALLGLLGLPARATDTGPCIDPMGSGCPDVPQAGEGENGPQLDPNGRTTRPGVLTTAANGR